MLTTTVAGKRTLPYHLFMQPDAFPVNYDLLKETWDLFMETGQLPPGSHESLDPAVLQSWRRCLPRLDYGATPRPKRLTASSLNSVLKAHAELMSVAAPIMEDIHQFIEGSGCAILLGDSSACMLSVVGDAAAIARVDESGLGQGAYWSEEQLGTNALGVARIVAMPVQVVGPEHYFHTFHNFVSTAAPIHDVRGRTVGLLAIVGRLEMATSHTLGLVMTAARAISNQLQTDWYIEEANRHLTEVKTILGAISEGVVAWNEEGVINHVNTPAARILDIRPAAVVGRPLAQALSLPPVVAQAAAENRELRDVEATFHSDGHPVHCLVNLRPVFGGEEEPIGYIAMLRPIEHVRRLVHQQIGARATLNLDDVSSSAPAMRSVLRQARIAARGTAPVLLQGEGGSGKNHLARAIHNEGPRADAPFIAINCQAIPHELMISEFLGYERDESSKSRPSKFELANGGTLLLDQLENLSLEMQAALLHLIETGHVMRLGSPRSIPVDVRIIAATTCDLSERVAEGSFISHLYYRFGVFSITIPPLRERVEDIPLLAERFLARITKRSDESCWIEDEAMDILLRYPWPGNVRELESVLERALNQSRDSTVHAADLPAVVRQGRVLTSSSPDPQPVLSIAEAEREAIIRAGRAFEGKVTKMAQQLGIGRTTLWRKMKRFDISPEQFKH